MTIELSQVRAIAFDLDGTLVDSAPDIQHALNSALKKAGLERFDLDQVRSWIGDGPDMLIGRALAHIGLDEADHDLRVRLRRWFDVATLAAPLSHGSVYPGILALVEGLRGRLPMTVVTNKPTPLARAVLDSAGLLGAMHAVHGGDLPAQRKPAPDLLLAVAQRLGLRAHDLLMVGDSALDLAAARAAHCPAALAAWGYGAHAVDTSLVSLRLQAPGELLEALRAAQPADHGITQH